MKKRNHIFAGFFLGVAGVVCIAVIFIYASSLSVNQPSGFTATNRAEAQKLYDSLTETDFATDYPVTPEEVMAAYCDTVLLLYGDMIADETLFSTVIDQQRQFFSTELLNQNTKDDQLQSFLSARAELQEMNASTFLIDAGESIGPSDETPEGNSTVIIPVTQRIHQLGTAYWRYHLENTTGQWKITAWEMTDEKFNPVEF